MAAKATVYKEKNSQPDKLKDLLDQVVLHFEELNFLCRANLPVSQNGRVVGYGVDMAKKTIACDHLASILKEIKKIKGF